MGRRVTKNNQRFVYNGYLQIANHHSSTSTSHFNYYIWDPTEPVATRPLAWTTRITNHQSPTTSFYTHDGNKNVSEVIASDRSLAAHYEYAPFGALTVSRGAFAAAKPWRFSSEYYDGSMNLVQYVFRDYLCSSGVFTTRDGIEHEHLYMFVKNCCIGAYDYLGLMMDKDTCESFLKQAKNEKIVKDKIADLKKKKCPIPDFECACCKSDSSAAFNPPERKWWALWMYQDQGVVYICRNSSKYNEETSVERVAGILEHELIHAEQSCQNCLGDNCEKRICAEIKAYLPVYRRSYLDFDSKPLIDKIQLMIGDIMRSCRDMCKGVRDTEEDFRNYMLNFFEECAK